LRKDGRAAEGLMFIPLVSLAFFFKVYRAVEVKDRSEEKKR